MKTRIRIHEPDYIGDIKVAAEVKESWLKGWEQFALTWVFRASYGEDTIAEAVGKMKRAIDDYRAMCKPKIIKYPEVQ